MRGVPMDPDIDEGLRYLLDTLHEETGLSFDPTRFENRLRIQKTLYLLSQLGDSPADQLKFNAYVRGPYSPALARLYYGKQTWDTIPPQAWEPNPISLKTLTKAIKRGTPFLEALATLHSLAEKNPDHSKTAIIRHAEELKPDLSGKFEEAWAFLQDHQFLETPTE